LYIKKNIISESFILESTNNCALITGGARRIGKEISLSLAKSGYDIALHYFSNDKEAQDIKSKITSLERKCFLYKKDFNDFECTKTLIEEVYAKAPGLCLLVNNASIFLPAGLRETSEALFDNHFLINFKVPFFLTKDFANTCNKGHVINIVDINAKKNLTNYFAYTLTKKGLFDFTKMAAKELAPNIRVNGICPGAILPPHREDESFWEKRLPKIPLQIKGKPEYITKTIAFLLDNPFITGECISVDGGDILR
jgi:NAD(P)-dependent dehydrogenase (short-subunit alcohol dehydrogenase family)